MSSFTVSFAVNNTITPDGHALTADVHREKSGALRSHRCIVTLGIYDVHSRGTIL